MKKFLFGKLFMLINWLFDKFEFPLILALRIVFTLIKASFVKISKIFAKIFCKIPLLGSLYPFDTLDKGNKKC